VPIETWFEHGRELGAHLGHVGPACRVGPVELGLNFDAIRTSVGERTNVGGVQAKWARPLTEKISIGVRGEPRRGRTARRIASARASWCR
jgi:hypothetical protein